MIFTILYLKKSHVSRVYTRIMLQLCCGYNLWYMKSFSHVKLLCFYIRILRTTCAVASMAVSCSPLTNFPVMLFSYLVNDSEMVRFAPIITGVTTPHALHILKFLYFKIFSTSSFITFISPKNAILLPGSPLLLLLLCLSSRGGPG
jgi:hypothetical protein